MAEPMALNFIHKTIGNVFVQRWTGQAMVSDIEPMLAALRGAHDALAPRARLIGVSIVPSSVALPTPAAKRAMEGRYAEMFELAAELYVVIEPGSFRSARLLAWAVNKVLSARGDMRIAHSVTEALADAKTPLLVKPTEVIARAREAGLVFVTDRAS